MPLIERPPNQAADCFGAGWDVGLLAAPVIKGNEQGTVGAHGDWLAIDARATF